MAKDQSKSKAPQINERREILDRISDTTPVLDQRKREIEKMILGYRMVEDI